MNVLANRCGLAVMSALAGLSPSVALAQNPKPSYEADPEVYKVLGYKLLSRSPTIGRSAFSRRAVQ